MAFPEKDTVNYLRATTFNRGYLDHQSLPIVRTINYGDCFKPSFWVSLVKEDYWVDGSLVWSNKKWLAYVLNVIFSVSLTLKLISRLLVPPLRRVFKVFERWSFTVRAFVTR